MTDEEIMRRKDIPRAKKQYSLRVELVKKVQHEAIDIGCFDSAVIEKALELYFATDDKVRRHTAHNVLQKEKAQAIAK